MRRFYIALGLLALLFWGSWWSVHAVQQTVDGIVRDIQSDHLDAAYQRWNDAQILLGSLLLHEELDQADRLFGRVLAAQQAGNETDYLLDRTELLAQLQHLPDLECPSLINLL